MKQTFTAIATQCATDYNVRYIKDKNDHMFTSGTPDVCKKAAYKFCRIIGQMPIFGYYMRGWVEQGDDGIYVSVEAGYREPQHA